MEEIYKIITRARRLINVCDLKRRKMVATQISMTSKTSNFSNIEKLSDKILLFKNWTMQPTIAYDKALSGCD